MELAEWAVVALQLDLLNNSPAVSVRNLNSGEIITVEPYRVIELGAEKKDVYGAGYVQGYSDRHYGVAFAAVG